MDTQEQIEYWLELADYDIETAKLLHDGGRHLYVGFMCKQVVEKAFKAVIAKAGVFLPETHDLLRLAELTGLLDFMDKEQQQLLHNLTPLTIQAGYPPFEDKEATQNLSEQLCDEYLAQTEEMLQWIKEKLSH